MVVAWDEVARHGATSGTRVGAGLISGTSGAGGVDALHPKEQEHRGDQRNKKKRRFGPRLVECEQQCVGCTLIGYGG